VARLTTAAARTKRASYQHVVRIGRTELQPYRGKAALCGQVSASGWEVDVEVAMLHPRKLKPCLKCEDAQAALIPKERT
jgi:hypothetical protein